MSKHHRHNFTPSTADTHWYKTHVDRRGVRPEKAAKNEYLSQFNKNIRFKPLKFESPKAPNNIFEQYDIGNKDLPAHKHEKEIIETIEANKVSVISGATGSGKTTQVPQMALKAGYDQVLVLQPRRINADGSGDRVETEIRAKMGDDYPDGLVGVAHSERNTIRENTKVKFMTADTFSNMLPRLREKYQNDKVLIIADETHENGVPTEFACALALQEVEKLDDWRMAYASATPDESLKTNSAMAGVNGRDISEIHIEGQPQNIDFSEDTDNDIIGTYNHQANESKKTMMFVEGIPAAESAKRTLLRSMSQKDIARTKIFILSSNTTTRDKDAIMNMHLKDHERAVVISTSAGQSGITIPGVDTVILSGITRSPEIDDEQAGGLPIRLCTQAELKQQGGRTGRDVPGRVILSSPIRDHRSSDSADELHRFVPMEDREVDMPPEVYNTNISRNALKVAAMGNNFAKTNLYMKNQLSEASVRGANELLFSLGAVDESDVITPIGARMDRYSFSPETSRAMIEFESQTERTVQIQALAIAAAIEEGSLVDYYGGNKWEDLTRLTSRDDYMAQLDLMIYSRKFFHGKTIEETPLKNVGIDFMAARRAHRQFDKMAKVMGLGDMRDVEIEPTTLDQENEIKDKILVGMPELIFEHSSTSRGVDYYKNVAGFQTPLERKVSNRSVISKIGAQAAKYLVGKPRWYIDKHGIKQNILESAFPVELEQVQRTLGHKAVRDRQPIIRGDRLVNEAPQKLGVLDIGGKKTSEIKVDTEHEREMMAQLALNRDTPLVQRLREHRMPESRIFDALFNRAEGVNTVHELDGRLWDLVVEFDKLEA